MNSMRTWPKKQHTCTRKAIMNRYSPVPWVTSQLRPLSPQSSVRLMAYVCVCACAWLWGTGVLLTGAGAGAVQSVPVARALQPSARAVFVPGRLPVAPATEARLQDKKATVTGGGGWLLKMKICFLNIECMFCFKVVHVSELELPAAILTTVIHSHMII